MATLSKAPSPEESNPNSPQLSPRKRRSTKGTIRVPRPEQAQILLAYVKGDTPHKIAKMFRRDRKTIGKIVKQVDWDEFFLKAKEFTVGTLLPLAIQATTQLLSHRDAKVSGPYGWKLMERFGLIPPKVGTVQPQEQDRSQWPEDEAKRFILMQIVEGIEERNAIFGGKLPDDLEEKKQQAIAELKKKGLLKEGEE